MSVHTEAKKIVVAEAIAEIAKANIIVIAEYRGVSVTSLTKLRAKARTQDVFLRVLKNTLARRAVEGTTFANLAEKMVGPLIYGMSADPLAAAKVLHQFGKTEDALVVKAGSYNGQLLSVADIAALSAIPDRQSLLAKLLGVMQSPLSSMARVLAAIATQKQTSKTEASAT